MRYWILPFALAAMYAGVSEAAIEKRHGSTGEYCVEADLVGCEQGWITLRTTDGRLIDLPAARLSRADQRWVRGHAPGPRRTQQPSSPARRKENFPRHQPPRPRPNTPIAASMKVDGSGMGTICIPPSGPRAKSP